MLLGSRRLERLDPAIVEELERSFNARERFVKDVLVAATIEHQSGGDVLGIDVRLAVEVADEAFQIEVWREIDTAFRGDGEAPSAVILRAVARDIEAVRGRVGCGGRAVKRTPGSAEGCGTFSRSLRAALELGGELGLGEAAAGFRLDGEHAGVRISAVETGLRAAQQFDALDV